MPEIFTFLAGFSVKIFGFFLLKTLQKPIFLFLFFVVFVCFLRILYLKKFFLRLKKNIFKLRKKLFMIKFFNNFLKKTLSLHQKLLFQGTDFVFSTPKFLIFIEHTRVSTRMRLLYFYNFSFLFFNIYKARHKKKLQPKLEFFDCLAAINALRIEVLYVLCGDRISYVLLHGGHV